jgi:hypothetical protein
MDHFKLRKVLEIKNRSVAISGNNLTPNIASLFSRCHGGQPIEIKNAEPGPGDGENNTVVIKGRADFLNVPDLAVEAKAFVDGDENVQISLKYTLPSNWKFSRSFSSLPPVVDWRPDSGKTTTIPLDELNLSEAAFVLVSDQADSAFNGGINVVGQMKPDGIVGIIRSIFDQEGDITVYGTVHMPGPTDASSPIEHFKYPWDFKSPVAGILLRGDLGLTKPLSIGPITLGNVFLRMYSPLSTDWFEHNPTYQPVIAYTGNLSLPSARSRSPSMGCA